MNKIKSFLKNHWRLTIFLVILAVLIIFFDLGGIRSEYEEKPSVYLFTLLFLVVGYLLTRLLKKSREEGYEEGRSALRGEIISAANDKLDIKWLSKVYQEDKSGKRYTTFNRDTFKAVLEYIADLQSYKNYLPDDIYSALRWHVRILGSDEIAGVNLDKVRQWIKQIYTQLEDNDIKPNEVKEIQFCKHGDSRIISDKVKKKIEFECKVCKNHQDSISV